MENNIVYTEEQLKQMGIHPSQTVAGQVNMMGLNIDL